MKSFVLPLLLAFAPVAAHAHHDAGATPANEATPATAAAPVTKAVPATEATPVEETVITGDAVAANDQKKSCIRETGTRIAARDEDGCTGHAGDSYDREDIDRSGAVDTADAVRKLSTSATIRH